jgi:hypothetical protein
MQSFSSILTIHNISSKDSANYTCKISNLGGESQFSIPLFVTGKYFLCVFFSQNCEIK